MTNPSEPACSAADCRGRPVVQWRRRPTDDEFAALVAAEESRRAEQRLLADPEQPLRPPGPPPTRETTTIAVLACRDHTIDIEAAALVHAADCSAPHREHLPGCDCTPKPAPEPEPLPGGSSTVVTLPTGWTVPAP